MTSRDPVRLADEAGAGELGEAIRASRAHGSPEQVAQLAARMAALANAGSLTAATANGLSPLAKALLGGCAMVAVGLGFWLAPGSDAGAPGRSAVAAPAAIAAPAPAAPEAAPVIETGSDTAKPSAPVTPRRRSRPRSTPVVEGPAPEHELALLERSRAALDREPALALEQAQAHARAYPEGVFAQEREVLAIDALLKLRRRAQAIARAERFVQRYPESSHVRRVRALLDREGLTVPATTEARSGDSTGNADRERDADGIER